MTEEELLIKYTPGALDNLCVDEEDNIRHISDGLSSADIEYIAFASAMYGYDSTLKGIKDFAMASCLSDIAAQLDEKAAILRLMAKKHNDRFHEANKPGGPNATGTV